MIAREPWIVVCQECGGSGTTVEVEFGCCGNALPSGECCAALYGSANVVPEEVQVQCSACRGEGVVELA